MQYFVHAFVLLLGWTFRKFKDKLIVKPSQKSVKAFTAALSETIFKKGKMWKQKYLIQKLNQQVRGWVNYHQSMCSKETSAYVDYILFELLWRWAKRRHPMKSKWLEEEYDSIKRGQGDTYLFKSQIGCLLLDLFQEPTDQNEMVLVGVRCRQEVHTRIKVTIKAIYDEAPVKSSQIDEGVGILDRLVSADSYPIEKSTITEVDGKETYKFLQNLKLVSS